MSRAVSKSLYLALIAVFGSTLCQGYISVPLTGYQQGIKLQIVPPTTTNEECYVYGVPTPFGYAPEGPTPLSVYSYKNTGQHVLEFEYKSTDYNLLPVFVPGEATIQVDTSDPSRPLVKFDSNQSPQGKYAYVSIQLQTKSGNQLCVSNIALVVEAPLSCLPTWGGVFNTINPVGPTVVLPSTGGQIVVPGGNVYAPTYVQNTVIQQFITINNVNINNINIINNVQQITNITIIQNVVAPPSPAPVNCTTTPTAPGCQSRTPTGAPTVLPPQPGSPTNGTGGGPPIIPIRPGSPITPGSAPIINTVQTVQPPGRAPTNAVPNTVSATPAATGQPPARAPTSTSTATTASGRRFRA